MCLDMDIHLYHMTTNTGMNLDRIHAIAVMVPYSPDTVKRLKYGEATKMQMIISILLVLSCAVIAQVNGGARTCYLDADDGKDSPECLNGTTPLPCQTLGYALLGNGSVTASNLQLFVYPGDYNYGETGLFVNNFTNLTVQNSLQSTGEVVFYCNEQYPVGQFNDLAFFKGADLTLVGITVELCGARSSGIYVEAVDGVTVRDCVFRNNTGGSLLLYNDRNIQVQNCTFMNNNGSKPDRRFSEGVVINNIYSSGGLLVYFNMTLHTSALISDCHFLNNSASISELNANDPRPISYSPFGSGGAILAQFANCQNNTVRIVNCTFVDNTAIDRGGSIFVPMIEEAENNTLEISDCVFDSSTTTGAGGAISLGIFDIGENNSMIISDSLFENNRAWFGGGAFSIVLEDSLASTVQTQGSERTIAFLRNCTFDSNYSPTGGSAVGLVSNARVDQHSPIVSFTDCNFTSNVAMNQSSVLAFRVPVTFEGINIFSGNMGGAVTLITARMKSKGTILFENNHAAEGGAVTLVDSALINLFRGTELIFSGNNASTVGGAIRILNPTVGLDIRGNTVFNTLCFMQYEVELENSTTLIPDEWMDVSVKFINNTAVHAGAAIYASDLSRCLFTSRECQAANTSMLTVFEQSIFRKEPFAYWSNNVTERDVYPSNYVHHVATEPATLSIIADKNVSAPGDVMEFTIEALDQSGNSRDGIWRVEDEEVMEVTHVRPEYFSVSDSPKVHEMPFQVAAIQNICMNGTQIMDPEMMTGEIEELEFFIIQALSGDIVFETHVNISISCCHPGYYYETTNINGTPICRFNSDYPHILRPEQNNRHVYLHPGYYAGFYKLDSSQQYFTTTLAPTVFLNCTQEGTRTGCLYRYENPDEQCVDNRTGFLCGQCPNGYGVDLTLRKCKECTAGDTVGLVIICILVVVFCTLVLVFNIGLPNDLKGFLFFAQVVGFVYQNGADNFSWDYHVSRLLGFSVYLPLCPFTSLSALWTAAFGFLPSILATATVTIYVISARFIRPLSHRSAFNGIWLISLFVYKYIADTTANILKCVKVNGLAEHQKGVLAFYYDGNIPCFAGEHLILAIPSLILLIVVVIVGPAFVIVIGFKRFKITQPFTDVITQGIQTKYRWWSGYDLLRRLMFVLAVTIFDFVLPEYTQLCLCFTTLIVLAILCIAKPYEKGRVNLIEAIILLDLLLIAVYFLNEREFRKVSTPYSAILLLLLPFIYALVNVCTRVTLIVWRKYIPMNPRKMKYWISGKLPKTWGGKPLLTTQRHSVDLTELQHSFPGDLDEKYRVDQGGESRYTEVDYSQFREELLEDL